MSPIARQLLKEHKRPIFLRNYRTSAPRWWWVPVAFVLVYVLYHFTRN